MIKTVQVSKHPSVQVSGSLYTAVLEAMNPLGMSAKIFVIKRTVSGNSYTDAYDSVSTASQMTSYPENAPASGGQYYRASVATLSANNANNLNTAVNSALDAVKTLTHDLSAADTAAAAQVYLISGEGDTGTITKI